MPKPPPRLYAESVDPLHHLLVEAGKVGSIATTREPGDLPGKTRNTAVGCDGNEDNMTTQTVKSTLSATKIVSLAFAAILGVAIISITGHVQAGALHDAAHDVRHATGFPCH